MSEEKSVPPDSEPKKSIELEELETKPEDSTIKVSEPIAESRDKTVESTAQNEGASEVKSDEKNAESDEKLVKEVKSEEGEEGFETPEEGEGKEEEEVLDDDQDVENPAYIPKTGKFYMHDSRMEDAEVAREEKRSRADGKWNHDRFDEKWQQPRTRRQLIDKYGFDIRLGETKEEAEEKVKEMKEQGIVLNDNDTEKVERTDGTRRNNRGIGRGARGNYNQTKERRPPNEQDKQGDNGGRNGDDDERPAERRDHRRNEDNRRQLNGSNRGGYSNRGNTLHSKQYNRTFNNSSRNGKDEEVTRGNNQTAKRYSTQRGSDNTISSSRQPTDIVYFDTSKQSSKNKGPPPTREKKPLDIVAPPSE